MRPIFKDEKLQAAFESDGYVKLKLFTPEQIQVLRDYYEGVRAEHEAAMQTESLYSSVETGNPDLLIALDQLVKTTIMDQVQAVFQNYQVLISNYLIKNSGDNSELMPHQDLTFVDEPSECSFNLWIPLQKTDADSGQLRVLKGSHKIKKTLRVVPEYPRPFVHLQDTIRALFTDIATDIGECVVLNHAVLHGSAANHTGSPRIAIILGMCSGPADIHYYYMPQGDSTRIEKYKMTPEDYYYFKSDGRPARAHQVDTIAHTFEPASVESFKHWIRRDPHLSLMTKINLLYFKSLQQ
ncbi:MAG: phytanoyl-CoA dioxygenase family protein [Bacteroidetes bacterium]|nr:phytanoyl-CoA dioxygenase family protein [Bacteroidota bacterium]